MIVDNRIPRLVPVAGARQPRLIVGLPQHVAEQVYQEKQGSLDPPALPSPLVGGPETPVPPAGARFAAGSRLVYVRPMSSRLRSRGSFDAMGRLPLAVVPLADPRFVWRLLTAPPLLAPVRVSGSAAAIAIDRVRVSRPCSSRPVGAENLGHLRTCSIDRGRLGPAFGCRTGRS